MDDLFDGLEPIADEGIVSRRVETEPSEPVKTTPEKEGSPILIRVQDTRPHHMDGGRTVLRPSLPYDSICHMASCFLDLYIGARYAPSPSTPGCVCHATVISGTVSLTAEGQTFHLLERDALRFAADQPYQFENLSNSPGRLLLEYQYLHGHS